MSWRKGENSKICLVKWQRYVWNYSGKNDPLHLPGVLVKKFCFVSKSWKKVWLKTWCDGENEPFNAECIFCNILVKWMSAAIQNKKLNIFWLTLLRCFLTYKAKSVEFSQKCHKRGFTVYHHTDRLVCSKIKINLNWSVMWLLIV